MATSLLKRLFEFPNDGLGDGFRRERRVETDQSRAKKKRGERVMLIEEGERKGMRVGAYEG